MEYYQTLASEFIDSRFHPVSQQLHLAADASSALQNYQLTHLLHVTDASLATARKRALAIFGSSTDLEEIEHYVVLTIQDALHRVSLHVDAITDGMQKTKDGIEQSLLRLGTYIDGVEPSSLTGTELGSLLEHTENYDSQITYLNQMVDCAAQIKQLVKTPAPVEQGCVSINSNVV